MTNDKNQGRALGAIHLLTLNASGICREENGLLSFHQMHVGDDASLADSYIPAK